jgi:hypothetical protein
MTRLQLRRLEPEPWGDRLSRARQRAGYRGVRQVEGILYPHVTKSALTRLEAFGDVPSAPKDRSRAALVLLLYGYELEDFDLGDTDIPPAIDLRVLERLRRSSTKCYLTDLMSNTERYLTAQAVAA